MLFNSTLARRHAVAFLVLLAIPVVTFNVVLLRVSSDLVVEVAREKTVESIERGVEGVDQEARNVAILAASLVHDKAFMADVRIYAEAGDKGPAFSERRFLAARGIEDKLGRFFQLTNRIGAIRLFWHSGADLYYRNFPVRGESVEIDRSVFAEAEANPGFVSFPDKLDALAGSGESRPVLSVAIRPEGSPPELAAILFSFRVTFFDKIAQGIPEGSGTTLISNRSGKVILASRPGYLGLSTEEALKPFVARHLVVRIPIQTLGWTVSEAIPHASLTGRVRSFALYSWLALAVFALLFVAFAETFFLSIINPIRVVGREMKKVGAGNYRTRVEVGGPKELAELGEAFNAMVEEISRLTDEKDAERRERTRVEVEALRFQLNPHFICNTLNAIRLQASIARVEPIKRMASDFIRIMQDSLSRDDELSSLKRELANLESYVRIMKVRYGDCFEYRVEVPDELLGLAVPTMLLQPIVENSILHGLRGMRTRGEILVSAKVVADALCIEVRDDGRGMDAATMEAALAAAPLRRRGLNRIGLFNVRRRLALAYGPPFGMELSSFPGSGTAVRFTLPLVRAVGGGEP
jgi:two-component system sensor histidine kinase YesM